MICSIMIVPITTVGAFSPRRISNSLTVPAVLTRHMQPSPITSKARQSPARPTSHLYARPSSAVTRQVCHPRHQQSAPVRLAQSSRPRSRYRFIPGSLSVLPSVPFGAEDGPIGLLGTLDGVLARQNPLSPTTSYAREGSLELHFANLEAHSKR